MDNLRCLNCNFYFSSKLREPRILPCNHTVCVVCLGCLFIENSIICPSAAHTEPFQCTYSSLQEIPINRRAKKQIEALEVLCSNHPIIPASFIDFTSFRPYCEDCQTPGSTFISIETLKPTLLSHLDDFSPSLIPQNYQNRLRKLKEDPSSEINNKDLLIFLSELFRIEKTICCQKHESRKASGFNFKTRELYCEDCVSLSSGSFKLIEANTFKAELLSQILWLRRSNDKLDSLDEPYEELVKKLETDLKEVLLEYRRVPLKNFQAKPSLKSVICSECKTEYTPENPPFIFHCVGGFTICRSCKESQSSVICGSCSSQSIRHPTSETEAFFSFYNSVPLCSYCKSPYNLKNKSPKELPCKHVLCLECLNQNYFRSSILRCSSCKTVIQNIKGLKSSLILSQQVLNNLIYCEKHKARPAWCIEKLNLRPWCQDCLLTHRPCSATCDLSRFFDTYKLDENLQPVKEFLETLFLTHYEKNEDFRRQGDLKQFRSLSNQEMLDRIRVGLEPQIRKKLRSRIPKGRILFDLENFSQSFVLRFFSLMPPVQKDPEHEFLCQPWRVDESISQIEAVSFKANKNFKLFGVVLGKPLYQTDIRIDVFEIIHGQVLSNNASRVLGLREKIKVSSPDVLPENKSQIVYPEFLNNPNKDEVFNVMIREPVELGAEIAYTLVIKFRGNELLFYRGNPFQIKDENWGSDGTVFEFFKVHNESRDLIEGQHEFNGPILGLIYETK